MKRLAPIVLLCMCSAGCLWSSRHLDTIHHKELSRDFTLTLTQPTNAFHINGSIVLEACFKNNSDTMIEANPFYPESGIFGGTSFRHTDSFRPPGKSKTESQRFESLTKVRVKRISGNPPIPPPVPRSQYKVAEPRPICLSPHQEQRFGFDLTNCSSWHVIDGSGVFEVDIIFESEGQPLEAKGPFWEGKISSNKIRIEILK